MNEEENDLKGSSRRNETEMTRFARKTKNVDYLRSISKEIESYEKDEQKTRGNKILEEIDPVN